MYMKLLMATVLICTFSSLAAPAWSAGCGWRSNGGRYCQSNLMLTGQAGATLGEAYGVRSSISDPLTRTWGRNLPVGSNNIVVDQHGICRYLGNLGIRENFVPFRTPEEWIAYLNNAPAGASASSCARELAATLASACGSVDFVWQLGKQNDVQAATFRFTRARDWDFYQPNSLGECVDSGETQTTTCSVPLSWTANADGSRGATPAQDTARWMPASAPAGDCEPSVPADSPEPECGNDILDQNCGSPNCTVPSYGVPVVHEAWSAQEGARGGTPPYSWTLIGGGLPPGYTMSPSGYWSVYVSTPGDYSATYRMLDARGHSGCVTFTWPVRELVISPGSTTVSGVVVGQPVYGALTASGGNGSYGWAVVGGSLPPGYAMDFGGTFSGTVGQAGTYSATIRATDLATGGYSDATYTWIISDP